MPYFHTIMNGTETATALVARLVSEAHATHGPDCISDIRDTVMGDTELDNLRDEFLSKLIEFAKDVLDAPHAGFIEYARFEKFANAVIYGLVNESITDFFNTPVYGEDAENEDA